MTVTRLGGDIPLLNSGMGSSTQIPSGGGTGQGVVSNGSNGATWTDIVQRITAHGSNVMGPFVNFAAGSNTALSFGSNTITIHSTGGGSSLTVADEGSPLATAATTLDFVGSGVVASGTGATKTITIAGGGGGGGLVLLDEQVASASATLDFASIISSTYDTYLFKFISIIPATSTSTMRMRMGTGGGPTYDTGGNYGMQIFRHSHNATSVAGGADSGATSIALTTAWLSTGVHPIAGSLELYDPQNASLHKYVTGKFVYPDSAIAEMATMEMGGQYNSTTAVTAVQFFMSSGNITSGVIRGYGIEK